MRLAIEGLTGTGKSSTIAAMKRLSLAPPVIIPEDETLGDAMDEIASADHRPSFFVRRLEAVISRLERERTDSFLLERAHLSYFALVPDWRLIASFDRRLSDLGVRLALLVIPDEALRSRSLLREEHGRADFQSFSERFGSEEGAIEALRASQARRVEALRRSRLSHTIIDTSSRDWDRVAREVAAWGRR